MHGGAGAEPSLVRLIEELAAHAWPAWHTESLDGWLIRHTPGVRARRSNSVLPLDWTGGPLDDRLALVEGFYASRELPARFQISPVATPAELDSILAGRGYEIEAPVDVQTAPVSQVLDLTAIGRLRSAPPQVHLTNEPDAPWLTLWTDLTRRGDPAVTKERVLDRIGPPAAFALVEEDAKPAAVGFGVVEAGWVGVFGMGTSPEARRRGLATSILHTLGRWASDQHAESAYLQVEAENHPAHRLYERTGFATRYRYHYRTRRS
jgi:GNAT superfamily N-acetyltransferase